MKQDEAMKLMQEMLVTIGCQEQWGHLQAMEVRESASEMERLSAFHELMDHKGGPRFNSRTFIRDDNDICQFRITRCVFYDFFSAVGAAELTRAFCEVDRRFFSAAFPGVAFHRGGSWENTIAYGKQTCEFVFENRVR